MNSEKSYKKFQFLYEIIYPILGLTALYCWEVAIELKIVLTIIILRVCYSWSEMAALEKGFVKLFSQRDKTSSVEPEIYSWAALLGLLFQMSATIIVSLIFAWALGLH